MSLKDKSLRRTSGESPADQAAIPRSDATEADSSPRARVSPAGGSARPIWRPETHEVLWNGRVLIRFRRDAANQTTVLAAFQEAGWPHRIDDPLPHIAGLNSKSCRWQTIKSLNRKLPRGTIRFHSGPADGICWEGVASTTVDKTTDQNPV